MNLGTVLRRLRTEHHYTQADLATHLQVSKSTISMYESGERTPTIDTMQRLADLFGVEIDTLCGRTAPVHASNLHPIKTKKARNTSI